MSSRMRNCIRDLENKEHPEKALQEYAMQYMQLHGRYARVNLMMKYYIFYETISERINPYIDSAREIADSLHQIIETFFAKERSQEVCVELADALLGLRREVIDRMEIITSYVDCFVVYEYILNRVQYRFEDMEEMPSDSVFAQELVNFIFSVKDNAAISDNIRFSVGQLPMRMSRSRYFDLIRESISIYKGSDVSSLESFLYIFRTNAMLYRDAHMSEYFTEFVPTLEELASLDYEAIDKDTYDIYAEKIRINASKLGDVSDLYMQIEELINAMYVICVTPGSVSEEKNIRPADMVIREINALFLQKEGAAGSEEMEEDRLNQLGEEFVKMEGVQEHLYEGLNTAGAVLDEVTESYKNTIEDLGMAQDFQTLRRLSLLTSNSAFADLEEKEIEEIVTEEMAEAVAAELIEECKDLFRGKSRMLRRAVMANTLENMPVFFSSSQEVADYITNSLSQCNDEAEKYASKQLLLEMMQ